jgi:DNA-binding HxlR family transcriptional regulator
MTESSWKVVVDRDRLMITSDSFTFTSIGTDPMQVEGSLADLQSALRETYGQYCGLSQAAEMVAERWGFLIVRDLLVGAKSVAELAEGLPRMSPEVLGRRLKEMAHCGIVQLVDEGDGPGEGEHARWELTAYGRSVEDAMLAFGRWGAAALAAPRPDDIVTDSSLMVALKATFLSDKAGGPPVCYEVHIGSHVLNTRIADGRLEVGAGPLPGADAVLDFGFALLPLMNGEVTADEVLASGKVRVTGDVAHLHRFVRTFQLPRLPSPKVPA